MSKYLVVGAGFAGAIYARELAEAGHIVDVIESRDHIGGNAYDYVNEHGIRVHKYGPHIFHTNNKNVVDYLKNFGSWIPYEHKVKAQLYDGRYVTLPVNKETKAIVGEENVLDTFFRPYTRKMWGKELDELNPGIINRVPIRDDMNELYFPNDQYQMMPEHGYTSIFQNILSHKNIRVALAAEFDKGMEEDYDHVFNSMPIDVYYDYEYGELPYRSLKFHTKHLDNPRLLPVPTVNFTHDEPFTRVTEWKNYPGCGGNPVKTTLTYEEPCDYKDNNFERYYPINDVEGLNRDTYKKYLRINNSKVTFIGRCGMYVYMDMHEVIKVSLAGVKKFLDKNSYNLL